MIYCTFPGPKSKCDVFIETYRLNKVRNQFKSSFKFVIDNICVNNSYPAIMSISWVTLKCCTARFIQPTAPVLSYQNISDIILNDIYFKSTFLSVLTGIVILFKVGLFSTPIDSKSFNYTD